jgi:2-phosphosulfolactate phosphatase
MIKADVLFTPAEFGALKGRDLGQTDCIVFDVLRATSSMVTALAHGAEAVIPVEEIDQALRLREKDRDILLAGERNGLRISTESGVTFDLGNSPREFTPSTVAGRRIAMTTTNGTRAMVACGHARSVWIGSFLNLGATVEKISALKPVTLLLVCGGTFDEAAYEDVLCAGAVIDLLGKQVAELSDAALLASRTYRAEAADLSSALGRSRNGRRLLEQPNLRDDVAFCAQVDRLAVIAHLEKDGSVRVAR